jgi:hypothetical protein
VPEVSTTTREHRLHRAVEASAARLVAASKERDEQAIFERLGECLTWMCALDDLLEPRTDYISQRYGDPKGCGQFLPGLRHARNQILHGRAVLDVADAADVPNPAGLVVHNFPGPRIVGPPTVVQWTFRQTLPRLTKQAPKRARGPKREEELERAYSDHVAGEAVTVPILGGVDWLDRALSAF